MDEYFFSIAWIYPGSFLCSSIARHLGAFQFQAVVNGSAVAIHSQVLYGSCPHCIEEGSEIVKLLTQQPQPERAGPRTALVWARGALPSWASVSAAVFREHPDGCEALCLDPQPSVSL